MFSHAARRTVLAWRAPLLRRALTPPKSIVRPAVRRTALTLFTGVLGLSQLSFRSASAGAPATVAAASPSNTAVLVETRHPVAASKPQPESIWRRLAWSITLIGRALVLTVIWLPSLLLYLILPARRG